MCVIGGTSGEWQPNSGAQPCPHFLSRKPMQTTKPSAERPKGFANVVCNVVLRPTNRARQVREGDGNRVHDAGLFHSAISQPESLLHIFGGLPGPPEFVFMEPVLTSECGFQRVSNTEASMLILALT